MPPPDRNEDDILQRNRGRPGHEREPLLAAFQCAPPLRKLAVLLERMESHREIRVRTLTTHESHSLRTSLAHHVKNCSTTSRTNCPNVKQLLSGSAIFFAGYPGCSTNDPSHCGPIHIVNNLRRSNGTQTPHTSPPIPARRMVGPGTKPQMHQSGQSTTPRTASSSTLPSRYTTPASLGSSFTHVTGISLSGTPRCPVDRRTRSTCPESGHWVETSGLAGGSCFTSFPPGDADGFVL